MSKRAKRRHHAERVKAWAYGIEKFWLCRCGRVEEPTARRVGMRAATRTPCSCFGCGNPRRVEKGKRALTFQEVRDLQRAKIR